MPAGQRQLNQKQKQFVAEYLIDNNATQAAIRAGYKAKNAHVIAYNLIHNSLVKNAIAEANAKRSIRTQLDQDWVLNSLKAVYIRSMEAEPVLDKQGEPIGVYTFTHAGATKSLELMAKMQGYLSEKIQLTGADGGAIKTQQVQQVDPSTLSTETLERLLADTARNQSGEKSTG